MAYLRQPFLSDVVFQSNHIGPIQRVYSANIGFGFVSFP
jgi:hypothetical protein